MTPSKQAIAARSGQATRDSHGEGPQAPAVPPIRNRPAAEDRTNVCPAYYRKKEGITSSSSIEFDKIRVDQCDATEGIRDQSGPEDALDYPIGEKQARTKSLAPPDPELEIDDPGDEIEDEPLAGESRGGR